VTAAGGPAWPLVLFVCTGNICRSPAAELLLRDALGSGPGIETASAGVAALVGEPVAAPMARLLRERGVDPEGFAARQFDPAAARSAALVLTMTTEQRATVVSRAPFALRRTFTLREFVRLVGLGGIPVEDGDGSDRLAALVRTATRARGLLAPAPDTQDIEDPYRRPDDVYARVLAQLQREVGALVGVLRPAHAA
jgi:protein-tyrosine phosphatase